MVTISLLSPLALLGLHSAMIRFLAAEKDKTKIQEGFYSVIFVVFFAGLLLSLIVFLLADSFAITILKDISAAPLIKIASVVILLQALDLASLEFFRTFGRMKKYSGLMLLQTFAEVGFVAYFVLSGFGLFGAVVSLIISRGAVLLIGASFIFKEIGFRLPKFYELKDYLKFGLPMVPSMIFSWIIVGSDRYIIGYFMTISAVGIYSATYNIGWVISMFIAPISVILFPTISKSYDVNEVEKVKTYLKYSLKYFLMLSIPSIFGILIFSEPILRIMTRPEFISSGKIIMPFIAISALFYGVQTVFGQIIMVFKKTNIYALLFAISAVCNIILNVILIPLYGILGAAIATFFTYALFMVLCVFISFRYLVFDIPWMSISKSVISSIAMLVIIWMLNPPRVQVIGVLILIVVGGITYFGMLVLLKTFEKEEISILKEMFKF
jgi:O-antigen/teichoic acid export membrane protein